MVVAGSGNEPVISPNTPLNEMSPLDRRDTVLPEFIVLNLYSDFALGPLSEMDSVASGWARFPEYIPNSSNLPAKEYFLNGMLTTAGVMADCPQPGAQPDQGVGPQARAPAPLDGE